MSLFGKILAAPFEIVNAPLRAIDHAFGDGDVFPETSAPLKALADELKKVGDDQARHLHSGELVRIQIAPPSLPEQARWTTGGPAGKRGMKL